MMSSKRSSVAWLHFSVDGLPDRKAKCNYCRQVLAYHHGSISNLARHLKAKHRSILLHPRGAEEVVEEAATSAPSNIPSIEVQVQLPTTSTVSTLELESASSNKPKGALPTNYKIPSKRSSSIWLHFVMTDVERAKCHYCNSVISVAGNSFGNLRRHLRNKHPTVAEDDMILDVSGNIILDLENQSQPPPTSQLSPSGAKKRLKKNFLIETSNSQVPIIAATIVSEDVQNSSLNLEIPESDKSTVHGTTSQVERAVEKKKTEFDYFGSSVAAQLNAMPWKSAVELQLMIQELITKFRLEIHEDNSH